MAIHAGKREERWFRDDQAVVNCLGRDPLPKGALVAVGMLEEFHSTGIGIFQETPPLRLPLEEHFGDYAPERWAWRMSRIVRLESPIACAGAMGLWRLPEELAETVREEWQRAFPGHEASG